jgi:hypothetical protein
MAKQSPKYRGTYTYVASQKGAQKANPKYRGIYAYDATNKPSGTVELLGGDEPENEV